MKRTKKIKLEKDSWYSVQVQYDTGRDRIWIYKTKRKYIYGVGHKEQFKTSIKYAQHILNDGDYIVKKITKDEAFMELL